MTGAGAAHVVSDSDLVRGGTMRSFAISWRTVARLRNHNRIQERADGRVIVIGLLHVI